MLKKITSYFFVFFLPILSSFLVLFAIFTQTLPMFENRSYWVRMLVSEFWATINTAVFIPYLRIANQFLNPVQMYLYGYFTDFWVQIFSNHFIFISSTTIDDYFAMIVMFGALVISSYKMFG